MDRLNTPPVNGEASGPKITASQLKKSFSSTGPALQFAGGSFLRSRYSRWSRLAAI